MNFQHNIVLNSDSYKYSQWKQYPAGTEYVYSYIEARGGIYDQLVFFGLQAFIKEYLTVRVTQQMIDDAEPIITAHGLPFNREGWEYIVNVHEGRLPIEIKSVEEGTVMPLKNVLVSVVNTDKNCAWLTSFLETPLLRAIWYPTTVCSNSFTSKQIIKSFLDRNGDPTAINFKLHDFGARGVSSFESAVLGGMAHLVNFMGTDTVSALLGAREYYGAEMAGFSIPAMEHSTVTSWGRDHEEDSYRNMLTQYAKPGALLACVSDSYDIFKACEMWGTKLKQQVLDSGAMVVIRPDSGNPSEVVSKCLQILDKYFGHTMNDKGYKVLNNVRIIQGDGINHASIRSIAYVAEMNGYSTDNIAFGQGGALLQIVNRDDLQFAMKCSAAYIDGKWVDVYKDPITSSSKKSKKGRLVLNKINGVFVTNRFVEGDTEQDYLVTRYCDGEMFNETMFDQIRVNANNGL